MSEFMPENDVAMEKVVKEYGMTDIDGAAAADEVPPTLTTNRKMKKRSGGFGFFRAALYVLSKKSEEKDARKKQESKDNKGDWKKIVGSMRPLHVQETPQSPIYHMSPAADEFMIPASPAASSSSCSTMSQYASALNLRDLDNADEEEGDPDVVFDAITGDEMIDAKAEEFIAQFYRQIQLQNSARYDREKRGN